MTSVPTNGTVRNGTATRTARRKVRRPVTASTTAATTSTTTTRAEAAAAMVAAVQHFLDVAFPHHEGNAVLGFEPGLGLPVFQLDVLGGTDSYVTSDSHGDAWIIHLDAVTGPGRDGR